MIRSIPTYFEKTVENHSAYFQQLFRDHYEPLCARAFQMVHDRKASEDIVQDVFLALWERREEVDFDRPLLPLLFVAVKNRAIDLLRSKKWRGGESGLDELDVCIIGKTKCDGIQNQMRLFGGRVSPKRKATKISHTHTKKHRSNGF